mgnify:CR=1 FL=1
MSYHWSEKITDYYYSNPELDTVSILWKGDDDLMREHNIKVDESDQQWRDFVSEIPYEEIDRRTNERHEEFREEFRVAFREYAERGNVDLSSNSGDLLVDKDFLFKFDPENFNHKENLFKLKLKLFEQVIVADCGSDIKFKHAKTFIRKATTPLDVLLGYQVFLNGADLIKKDKEKFEVEGIYVPLD